MRDTAFSRDEIARFNALADRWWDRRGPMRPLHAMNPARIGWITARCEPAAGGRLLDVGCGAGLAAEALARHGFDVLGIDAAEDVIAAARTHAEAAGNFTARPEAGEAEVPAHASAGPDAPPRQDRVRPGDRSRRDAITPRYRVAVAEDLLAEGLRFPVITALEVIEHVPDPAAFVRVLVGLLEPMGKLFLSTLNRTTRSLLTAKLGAEYVLRLLPVGTHDWRAFITPPELAGLLRDAGARVTDTAGLSPALSGWRVTRDLGVNYLMAAEV